MYQKLPLNGRIYKLTIGRVLTTNVLQINLGQLLFKSTLKVRLCSHLSLLLKWTTLAAPKSLPILTRYTHAHHVPHMEHVESLDEMDGSAVETTPYCHSSTVLLTGHQSKSFGCWRASRFFRPLFCHLSSFCWAFNHKPITDRHTYIQTQPQTKTPLAPAVPARLWASC